MKAEEINKLYFGDVDKPVRTLDRRDFIKKLGGGLIIVFSLSSLAFKSSKEDDHDKRSDDASDLNAYLRIREDGKVDCFTGKVEMGQGIITSLAQVLSEELEVPMESINVILGDTELCPYDAGTWGSLTTRFFDPLLRAAAAEAKTELILLASKELNIEASQLKTESAKVVSKVDTNKHISYAELTKGKKIVKTASTAPVLKKPSEFKTIGQPFISTDAINKVTGKAKYSADIQLPGMLYASIKRPPAHGATIKTINTQAAKKYDGAIVIHEGELVAVLHENPLIAEEAAVKIKAEYNIPESKANDRTIFEHVLKTASFWKNTEEKGDADKAFESAEIKFDQTYYDGYKAHASIETHTATATFEGDKLVMWVSTQTPFGTRKSVAETLKMPIEKVHIKQIFIGGGFGGKIYNQQAIECAQLAKLSGKPVQVVWTRREEFMYDMFRPAAVMKIKSGVNKAGKITAWNYSIYGAGPRGTQDFYNITDLKTGIWGRPENPFGTGAWRAPGNNTTTFARESQIDIMANEIGIDPVEFRLKNITDKQIIAAVNLATKTFGYKSSKTGKNKGCGMAIGLDAGTIVVLIAEVEVNPSNGKVTPLRMVCAQDMGQVVNPHGATVQTEGGLTMGLGYALWEDIKFNWGEVKTRNFDTYEITKFSTTPPIECVFTDNMETPPQGGGEPAIITVGGAIANAVFHASGARVNQMPITPERILNSLE